MNILNKWKDNISKFMKWTSEFIALNLEEGISINYLVSFSLREKDKFKTKGRKYREHWNERNGKCPISKWTNCKIFSLKKLSLIGKLKFRAIYITLELVNQHVVFYPWLLYGIMSSGLHSKKVKAIVVNLGAEALLFA